MSVLSSGVVGVSITVESSTSSIDVSFTSVALTAEIDNKETNKTITINSLFVVFIFITKIINFTYCKIFFTLYCVIIILYSVGSI